MKCKGTWENDYSDNIDRRETTRVERVQIIVFRDSTEMTWKEIGYDIGVPFKRFMP